MTQHDEAEALYREAQQTAALLDALYRSAPVGLGFWDRDLRYVRVNEALAAINERSAEDHVGRTFREVVPQLADELEELARGVLESGVPVIGREMTAGTPGRPDRLRHWRASYYPVTGPDGERLGVGAVIEETTDRRRAEQLAELQHAVTSILSVSETADEAVHALLRSLCETLGFGAAVYAPADPAAPRLAWGGEPESAAASVPVLVEGTVAGVIEVFARAGRDSDPELVDPELVESLEATARQLGQFLRRERAEEERTGLLQRERTARAEAEAAASTLRKLERVSEAALEHLSLQGLLDALLARIVEVLEADSASILLVDDGKLHVRASVGLGEGSRGALAIPLGAGMAGRVAESRTPLLVPDTSKIDLFSPVLRDQGVNSIVAIPLIVEDRVIGVVHAGSAAYAQFVEDDARLLELIADRIALAINQASLYEAERSAQGRLRFLGEASALLGSSLEVERTLEQLGELVAGRIADWCSIHLVAEAEGPKLVSAAHVDAARAGTVRERLRDPAAVARVGAVIADGGWSSDEQSLVVPLSARGRTFGTLWLGWDERARPSGEADLDLALDLARRVAVAIDNAQLYGAAAERAQAARVLASVGDGVFLVDRAGYIRTWNRAAAVATGLPASAVVDRLAAEAIPGWGAIAPRIEVASGGSGAPRPESLPLDLGTREVWLSVHGVAVPDGVVYAFRDLTEERALEQMRTEFVSTVSHELRTPLAAIYGAAMTLRRSDVALDEQQRAGLLDVVSGEADRLARTVNDILWASRLDSDSLNVTIQNCDPLVLVDDVVKAQVVHLDRAHELKVDAAQELPLVTGDPDKVGRVLINLVDNAVKYSPDGGRVTVKVAHSGAQVRFSVTDEGLGIPFSEQRRVFEKFYRLDPNMNRGVGGTGLGLYICRELVRRMDGRIWIESAGIGRGSTFHFELPAAVIQ